MYPFVHSQPLVGSHGSLAKFRAFFWGGVLNHGQIAVRRPLIGASCTTSYTRAPWWAHDDSTAIYPTHCLFVLWWLFFR
jgi:hypothetical protein